MTDIETPVRVAVGVLRKDNLVLLCQRGINHRYGLKWEFPGGKTYPDESIAECLERELWEELRVEPVTYTELKTLQVDYPDGGSYLITFFQVPEFTGDPENRVFEKIAWVPLQDIRRYDVLEGTLPILHYL